MNFSKAVVKMMLSMKSCTHTKDKISRVQGQAKGNESLAQHFVLREELNKSLFAAANKKKKSMLLLRTLKPCPVISNPIARVIQTGDVWLRR